MSAAGRRGLAATVVALIVAAALPAGALAACPRTSVVDIEDEVMCPVCETPLALAQEAPQADRQRVFILERVERCESKAEIKAALAAEFGGEVLALPEDEGFDLAAYLVPGLALLAALAACMFAVARWRRARPAGAKRGGANDGPGPDDAGGDRERDAAANARLERDLERYDT